MCVLCVLCVHVGGHRAFEGMLGVHVLTGHRGSHGIAADAPPRGDATCHAGRSLLSLYLLE